MGSSVVFILLLSILHSVLFYSKSLGLNVVLFIVPLLVFLVMTLKNHKKIKNKCGFLFIVPIVLLSITYFIYDNSFTRGFNLLVIPLLLLLTYIFTISPTYNLGTLLEDIICLVFEPLNCIGKFYNIVSMKLDKIFHLSDSNKRKIHSFLIVIPIVVVVLLLLSSADMIFNNIFKNFFDIFKNIALENIIGRIIIIAIFFTYLGCVINYLLFNYKDKKKKTNSNFKVDNYTIKLLLTVLNVIYIVFDFIQIKSLMLHKVAQNINYAQYARTGFFQLMFISLINITILLISKRSKEENSYSKVMSLAMVLLTLVIIISSILRMHMYESVYGYTTLRLLVYAILTTEIILLIPTIIYIFNSKFNILKYYMTIVITAYTVLCFLPIDAIITKNNINLYNKTHKIDIYYLENFSSDNIPLLVDFYNSISDKTIKDELEDYLKTTDFYKTKGFQEYNISKTKAKESVKKLKY